VHPPRQNPRYAPGTYGMSNHLISLPLVIRDNKYFQVLLTFLLQVHPVGWCATKGKPLIPPKTIQVGTLWLSKLITISCQWPFFLVAVGVKGLKLKKFSTVLRIRDFHPGSSIPDPIFSIPDAGYRSDMIPDPDPHQRI
jgi:hypothetical protein